jgi:hypothetical protein
VTTFELSIFIHLFICAYIVWAISFPLLLISILWEKVYIEINLYCIIICNNDKLEVTLISINRLLVKKYWYFHKQCNSTKLYKNHYIQIYFKMLHTWVSRRKVFVDSQYTLHDTTKIFSIYVLKNTLKDTF